MRFLLFIFFFILVFGLQSKAQNYYWIGFSDKNNTEYSLSNPQEYISEQAIVRRAAQNIPIDSLDLPVNKNYIDSVLTLNVELVHKSKWLNGITVKTNIDSLDNQILDWSFIREVQLSKPKVGLKSISHKFDNEQIVNDPAIDTSYYGNSVHQIGMMEGQFLHQKGYRGEGMQIAVLDAGFLKTNELPAFDSLWTNKQIIGTRDFVNPNSDFYAEHYHGMSVLSCMGGNIPGELIGTAPAASYLLLRSEDANSEFIIEEDNWIAAAEYADSIGVDIINSSLGYYLFDDVSTNHTYADMDGKTTRVTRGANIAASRGILVFASAGNERNDPWQRIIAPSDGDLVIGVGAVDKELNPANFTSAGPSSDGDVKPNVSAMGYHTVIQKSSGDIGIANGTSFSSPVLAGMAACLWQRYPHKSAAEIKDAIERSGQMFFSPDSLVGYGVPNMRSASAILDPLSVNSLQTEKNWNIFPNPAFDHVIIHRAANPVSGTVYINLYSFGGQLLKTWHKQGESRIIINEFSQFGSGVYILRVDDGISSETFKLSKVD